MRRTASNFPMTASANLVPATPPLTTTRPAFTRKAIATLEFVMCVPLLATLMVLLVWLGFSVIGKSQVTSEARSKAWRKRFDTTPGTVLLFLKDDFASERATTTVKVSPLLNRMAPPTSKHDVMMSTWDAKTLPMNTAPHWKLYATVAINAKTAGLQNAYTDAKNVLDDLGGVAQGIVSSMLSDLTGMDSLGDSSSSETNAQEDEQREKLRQDKIRLEQQVRDLFSKIVSTEGDIATTQAKILVEKDAEKKKELQRELALQQIKLERMQSDLHDAREELDAVNEAL